jgi:protein SCO1/2
MITPPETANPTPRQRLKAVAATLLLTLAVASLVGAIALPTPFARKPKPAPDTEVPADFSIPVPDFSLTDRSGKTVTKADLLGKVWVASFVFTRCTGPCPSVTATVAKLQADLDLAHADDVRLVTFTVDPGRDSPAVLAKYAETFHADPTHWLFLTGDKAALYKLINKGFLLLAEPAKMVNPPAGQEIDHSSKIAVVDKAGNVRGVFDGYRGANDAGGEHYATDMTAMRDLIAELRR